MSTLHTNTVETSSGGAVTLTKQSACKAWIGIDQVGTTAIHGGEASFNISSIVDNSTGTTEFDFTNNFSSDYYCGTAADHYAGNSVGASPYPGDPDAASHSPSGTLIQCYNTSGTTRDTSCVNWHGMGDLA